MDDDLRASQWTISYRRFFLAKLRLALLSAGELPAEERPFRLFSISNDVISGQIRSGGAFEPEVLGMIAAVTRRHGLGSAIALDVGANIGNHAIWMAQRFAYVVAFEPSPVIATVLRANRALNQCDNLHVEEVALAECEGAATLVTMRSDHIGTLELDEKAAPASDTPLSARVRLRAGDQLLQELPLPALPVSFIKIDVEGAEVRALTGLRETLCRDHPVICFEARNPSEGGAVRQVLQKMGYSYFYAIEGSRLGLRQILTAHKRRTWFKHYRLVPLESFQQRHYAAVFAWNRELT